MKYLTLSLALVACLEATAFAGPLQKTDVAPDAKWLLHLDVDQLRSTPQGAFIVTNIANTAFASVRTILKSNIGFELDLSKVHSLTAYGSYQGDDAVLLFKSDFDVEKVSDAMFAYIQSEGKNPNPSLGKSQQDGIITYTLRDHMTMTVRSDGTAVLGKSPAAVAGANDVISGKAPNLTSGAAFADFPDLQKSFFFFAAAEGFNAIHQLDDQSLGSQTNNPKAKILKMTDSGRLILGQSSDRFFANISLKAKTATVVNQMQQVVQGLVALASLTQSNNEDVQTLADSAKVSATGQVVSLNVDFPADKALLLLQSNVVKVVQREQEHEQNRAASSPDTTNGK